MKAIVQNRYGADECMKGAACQPPSEGNPTLSTLLAILRAVGVNLTFTPARVEKNV